MPPASSVTAAVASADAFPRPTACRPVQLSAVMEAASAAAGVAAPVESPTGEPTMITGITLRAADVHPGDLFAALPGSRVHGADFVGTALAAGAAAVLTDPAGATRPEIARPGTTSSDLTRSDLARSDLARTDLARPDMTPSGMAPSDVTLPGTGGVPVVVHEHPRELLGPAAALIYGDPTARLSVLGVTGTSGKTTVAHLLEAGLVAGGATSGLLGTVGTRIDGPDPAHRRQLPSAFTTPEAPDLQAIFAVMVEAGVSHVAMEVSSHALALGRVAGTRFAVAAFTNLSQDHLDFHGDMESYFQAKTALFDGRAERAVICVDDSWGQRLAADHPDAVTVSTTGAASWRAAGVQVDPDGTQQFDAFGPDGVVVPVRLALPGAFNVANALVALACLDAAGVPVAVAAQAFARLAVPGRMQRIDAGQPFLAVVDYAHKPAAVAALLDTLRAQVPGRLIVVLGCGGDRDRGKRPLMGAAAATRAELLVVTDDNPRGEDPARIRAAVLAGARAEPGHGEVLEVSDRREAIEIAVAHAGPGDAVVVAGKGHETGQEINGSKLPFDDATELAAALGPRTAGARG